MNTEEKNGSQENETKLTERSLVPFGFFLSTIILVILSLIFLAFYTIYMHYKISLSLTVYCAVALTVFILEVFALRTANKSLYKIAVIVASIFLFVQPASSLLIGTLSSINSLYTYAFGFLSFSFILIAVAILFFHLRKESLNLNSQTLSKVIFSILTISNGIMCGTTVLRYTYIFSIIAAIIAFLSPLSIFLPLSAQRKILFRIIKTANIVLLIGLFLFYIDMFLVFFEVSPFNLGKHSQLYNLYEIYSSGFLVVPENHAWLCTQFFEAFFEILYPIVLLVNVEICHNKQTEL